ncbi:hypothetical protein B0H13DRAFT_1611735 [Mycena leptocephala]|nr:hypothetical protein B0H13DRAFT_1611735 [Mycena leptocephala]
MHPIKEYTLCIDGYAGKKANNTHMCRNLDLYSFTPHGELENDSQIGNDIWGWSHTSSEGVTREFGLVGQFHGTAFVEVLPTGWIAYLGRLSSQTRSLWRDIKVIGHYAYIGSESPGHRIQVFDLLKLLDSSLLETDLTSHYDGLPVGSSHNVVFHANKNLIVAVGANPRQGLTRITRPCGAGLIFVDMLDPTNLKTAGCAGEGGYVHDAQCLTYYSPDVTYNGSVQFALNYSSSASIISATPYYGVSYSHQGWVVDEKDQSYVLMNVELDEGYSDQKTTTYIWDIKNLAHSVLTGYYKSPVVAVDHKLYIVVHALHSFHHTPQKAGCESSIVAEDPTGGAFSEIAIFDVRPEDDIGGDTDFGCVWSTYPYFESRYILVNTLERKLFVMKYNKTD